MVCASQLWSVEFSEHGYPTVYRWESTQLTMSPKELKWSSPPTNYSTTGWQYQDNSSSSVGNSNHKPKSFKFNTIYLKDTFTSRHENNNQSVNPNLNNVTNNSYKLLTMLYLPTYRTSQNKS